LKITSDAPNVPVIGFEKNEYGYVLTPYGAIKFDSSQSLESEKAFKTIS
jgi:hypothetical protein